MWLVNNYPMFSLNLDYFAEYKILTFLRKKESKTFFYFLENRLCFSDPPRVEAASPLLSDVPS